MSTPIPEDVPRCTKCFHPDSIHNVQVGCTASGCDCKRSRAGRDYHGDDGKFRAGNPGKPDGARPRVSMKRLIKRVVSENEDEILKVLKELMLTEDAKVKAFFNRFVTEQLDGRAVESIKLSGGDAPIATYDLSKVPLEKLRELREILSAARVAEEAGDAEGGG